MDRRPHPGQRRSSRERRRYIERARAVHGSPDTAAAHRPVYTWRSVTVIYACCDERRLDAVRSQRTINGIDYLEVLDGPRIPIERRQHILYVHFVHPFKDGSLKKENVHIDGGERIRTVTVTSVEIGVDNQSNVLTVHIDKPGDLSTYTLRLVFADKNSKFDPIL